MAWGFPDFEFWEYVSNDSVRENGKYTVVLSQKLFRGAFLGYQNKDQNLINIQILMKCIQD